MMSDYDKASSTREQGSRGALTAHRFDGDSGLMGGEHDPEPDRQGPIWAVVKDQTEQLHRLREQVSDLGDRLQSVLVSPEPQDDEKENRPGVESDLGKAILDNTYMVHLLQRHVNTLQKRLAL